jgi:hypothetical protein
MITARFRGPDSQLPRLHTSESESPGKPGLSAKEMKQFFIC